jgi:hypothetical protein
MGYKDLKNIITTALGRLATKYSENNVDTLPLYILADTNAAKKIRYKIFVMLLKKVERLPEELGYHRDNLEYKIDSQGESNENSHIQDLVGRDEYYDHTI